MTPFDSKRMPVTCLDAQEVVCYVVAVIDLPEQPPHGRNMNRMRTFAVITAAAIAVTACAPAESPDSAEPGGAPESSVSTNAASIKVDRSNYQQAEVARNFTKWAARGANNKLMHMTTVTPSGPAPTVRMNRDTLYSAAILDTSSGNASITLPEGDLYQSVLMIDTDGYARKFIVEPGTHKVAMDTKFVWVLVRTGLEKGIEEALGFQALVTVQGMGDDTYSATQYDHESLAKLTRILVDEAMTEDNGDLYYGNYPGQVDETRRLRSTAAGFGGMYGTNMYKFVEAVDNNVCMQSAFVDPNATEFFSFTLYDTDGYLMDGNSIINSRDMVPNSDGTYTVSINCGDDAINNISAPADIETIGYAWRVYGASKKVENRTWDPIDSMRVIPEADIVKK